MTGTPQTPGTKGGDRGGAFYDEPEVFERYRLHRQWPLNPNVVMEEPALLAELGDASGLRVLDLGCGDASIARVLLDGGATRYLGVDGSEKMIEAAARALHDTTAELNRCDIEEFRAEPESFDLVLSRMALHYIDDPGAVLSQCRRWLSPGGRVVFTVVHPVISSHDARASTDQPRQDWVIDDYFIRGPREQEWLGGKSRWFHRTIEDYVQCLHEAGFALTALRECPPVPELFDDVAEYERRRRIPLMLLLAGTAHDMPPASFR